MKIYTFQPTFIWEVIQQDGFYHPFDLFEKNEILKEDLSLNWGLTHSYLWLKEKMLEKGVIYKHYHQHLIWGWAQWYGNKKKPDKRYSSVFSFSNEPFVMMELDIDSSRVSLTDYDAWHYVLNYLYIGGKKESDSFSEKFNYYQENPLSDPKADKELKDTWDHIFDLDKICSLLQYPKEQQSIQATFFEIFLEDVKKVHYFENKCCIKIDTISQ